MSISVEEVTDFMYNWFNSVGGGATGDEQAKFHLHRDARLFIHNGGTFTLDEHHALHQQWVDEKHELGHLELVVINNNPERLRVKGTVYWEARTKNTSETKIYKTVENEMWMIERTPNGLRFILYLLISSHVLPGSNIPEF